MQDKCIGADGQIFIHTVDIQEQKDIFAGFFYFLADAIELAWSKRGSTISGIVGYNSRSDSTNSGSAAPADLKEQTANEIISQSSSLSDFVTMAVSTMNQCKNAFVYHYRANDVKMDKSIEAFFKEAVRGYKEVIELTKDCPRPANRGIYDSNRVVEDIKTARAQLDDLETSLKRQHSELKELLDDLPKKIAKHIMDNIQIVGIKAPTAEQAPETLSSDRKESTS